MANQDRNQKSAAGKALRYLQDRGVREFTSHAVEKVRDRRFDYQRWIRAQEPSSTAKGYQKKLVFRRMPDVIVMILRPEGEAEPDLQTLQSVRRQTYQKTSVSDILTTHISDDAFVLCVRNRSLLTEDALFRMIDAAADGADAVYADEDSYERRSRENHYSLPLFKPDYNPDYLRSCNYIGTPFMVRAGLIRSFYKEEGAVPSSWTLDDPAAYYEYVLRCSQRAQDEGGIVHVPRVLCHVLRSAKVKMPEGTDIFGANENSHDSRSGPNDSADVHERMRCALERDLIRNGSAGRVEDGPWKYTFHVAYDLTARPLVSIVIPNKDSCSVLENCIWSVRNKSTYTDYEIIVVENNSKQPETFDYYRKLEEEGTARIVRYEHPFHFSRVVNEGVRNAHGEYVILMNNDVTVRTPDWIERLLAHCLRQGVGAAGPKLLYPDLRVQSAGIVAGIMGYAGSMMVLEDGEDPGYMGRGALTQDMSALTAACMMVKKDVYQKAGGFADDLPVALNDVDFCLKLVREGYRNVLEPTAVMIHHESLSRGHEDTPDKKKRFNKEKTVFRKRWAEFLKKGDPAYNPNLSRRRCDWSQQT